MLPSQGVETDAGGALQPQHPFYELGPRSFHRQMVMIPHDYIRMEQPAALRRGLKKCLFEQPGAAVVKKFLAIVASAQHMVDRSRKLQPRFPRHLATVIKRKVVFYRTDKH